MYHYLKAVMLLIFISLLSRPVVARHQGQVTITVNVVRQTALTPKVFGINFLNPFEKIRKSATINHQSRFLITGEMRFAQNMTIAYNNTFINLYVAPGDSVHLEIDAALLNKPNFQWLKISGDHARVSSQLNQLHDAISKLPYKKYDYSVSVPTMLDAIKSDYNRYIKFIAEYEKLNQLDALVHVFFQKDIKFSISSQVADYVDEGSNITSSRAERISMFRDSFFAIDDDSNFITMMYPYHLANYQYWKVSEDSVVVRAKKMGKDRQSLESGIKLLQSAGSAGLSRDYMIYNYVDGFLKRTPSIIDSLPDLKRQVADTTTYAYLRKAAERAGSIRLPQTMLSEIISLKGERMLSFKNTDFIDLINTRYKGKVIYLDIYATWCAPCLKEMEFSPQIHHLFAGQDVVFINLCMQSSKNDWKALIKNKKLTGEQYFLGIDDTKLLMGNYNISGFPTYMLIGRNGKVATTNASRPSELQRLKNEVQKLLMENSN